MVGAVESQSGGSMDRAVPAHPEAVAADLRGKGKIWYITPDKGKSMLRIVMKTLNGKQRQTAVAAFARMPDPPPRR